MHLIFTLFPVFADPFEISVVVSRLFESLPPLATSVQMRGFDFCRVTFPLLLLFTQNLLLEFFRRRHLLVSFGFVLLSFVGVFRR